MNIKYGLEVTKMSTKGGRALIDIYLHLTDLLVERDNYSMALVERDESEEDRQDDYDKMIYHPDCSRIRITQIEKELDRVEKELKRANAEFNERLLVASKDEITELYVELRRKAEAAEAALEREGFETSLEYGFESDDSIRGYIKYYLGFCEGREPLSSPQKKFGPRKS